MVKVFTVKEICHNASREYLVDFYLLDLSSKELHLFSPKYGDISEKFLVPLDRLKNELTSRKNALLFYEADHFIVYVRPNIGFDYAHVKTIRENIEASMIL